MSYSEQEVELLDKFAAAALSRELFHVSGQQSSDIVKAKIAQACCNAYVTAEIMLHVRKTVLEDPLEDKL